METNWSNGEQCKKVAATSRRPNVATFPRHDVPTSRRFHVTTSQRRDVSTSQRLQRHDVSTSRRLQRRDVGSTDTEVNNLERRDAATSQRLNVVTLQRCDVSSRSPTHHLKYEWLRNQGIRRRTNEGTKFQSRLTQTSKKFLGFVLFLIFWILE